MTKSGSRRRAPPSALAALFHHRWAVPVLAELCRLGGAKFVTLSKRLGVGRDTLSRTLKALDEQGWAVRNPGHGHPLRPEYILPPEGRTVGKACLALYDQLLETDVLDVGLKKWSLPVLLAIGTERRRFAELSTVLDGATPRALTQALKALVEAGLVKRTLVDEYPPRPEYTASEDGRGLLPVLRRLASAA